MFAYIGTCLSPRAGPSKAQRAARAASASLASAEPTPGGALTIGGGGAGIGGAGGGVFALTAFDAPSSVSSHAQFMLSDAPEGASQDELSEARPLPTKAFDIYFFTAGQTSFWFVNVSI